MSRASDILVDCLRRPELLAGLLPPEWEMLIRQARAAMLLGCLHRMLEERGELNRVPHCALRHLAAERLILDNQHRAVRAEVEYLRQALGSLPGDLVLLKGAAYVMAGLPNAAGRRFSDVDILVPRTQLDQTESELMLHGWGMGEPDPYDQRYYRQWMHELPPMEHARRGTVVDVHHGILPSTGRLHPSSEKLLAAAIPVPDVPGVRILSPSDMVLHSACHLFHDGELEHGLRDLVDLDGLLRHFGQSPAFWTGLIPRARELELERPLYYALRYLGLLLHSPLPAAVLAEADTARPPAILLPLMDALFLRALRPAHPGANDRWTRPARLGVYVRAHWLRMPPFMLALHLTRKALRRKREDD